MSLITNYWDIFRSDKLKEKFEEVDNTIYVEEVEITAAQLIAMNGAAVEVVPAEGAGKVLELVDAVFIFDYGTVQFTGGGAVVLEEETSATALSGTVAAAVFTAAADSITKVLGVGATLTANKGIFISNATAAFADGDGVLRLKVAYRVHSTGL